MLLDTFVIKFFNIWPTYIKVISCFSIAQFSDYYINSGSMLRAESLLVVDCFLCVRQTPITFFPILGGCANTSESDPIVKDNCDYLLIHLNSKINRTPTLLFFSSYEGKLMYNIQILPHSNGS